MNGIKTILVGEKQGERGCGKIDGVWIPGCTGGAVYGPVGCTCKRVSRTSTTRLLLAMARQLDRLETDVKRMRKLVAAMQRRTVKRKWEKGEAE